MPNPLKADDELNLAVRALVEITGCDRGVAVDLVDSIARYTTLKAQSCLPAGWGRRG